jgi:hypothetical protein
MISGGDRNMLEWFAGIVLNIFKIIIISMHFLFESFVRDAFSGDKTIRKNGEDSWNDRVKNEVLHRVKEERSILHTIKRREVN